MSDELPQQIPVFPLPGLVLLPGQRLPLHIFEPRYREMIRDSLAARGWLALACVEDPDAPGVPAFSRIATAGRIVAHQPLHDGRSNILLEGQRRVLLEELATDSPYRVARATPLRSLSNDPVAAVDVAALLELSRRVQSAARAREAAVDLRISDGLTPVSRAMLLVDSFVINPALRLTALRCERGGDLVRIALGALAELIMRLEGSRPIGQA